MATPAGALAGRIAGVDEAGRGPWAGPVVAAAVILRTPRLPVRIDDSKRLTRLQRERACAVISRRAEVGFGIVCAEEIDRRNILQASLRAMELAIDDLPSKPDAALVDGAIAPVLAIPCRAIIRGDQICYVISCASIMAKVLRDGLMDFYHELAPAYGFSQHKGYGTSQHARNLGQLGPCALHRLSFRPVIEAMALSHGPRADAPRCEPAPASDPVAGGALAPAPA